tara:strand:- start:1563 stop:2294 length:732 start_codon:yes stop_codon:yes gene_type:complete
MTEKVNIICMKWGDKFPAIYVNRLYGMIARNITLPFDLYCFTDQEDGIRNEVKIKPLPKLALPKNIPERGWQKLSVLSKNFGGLSGSVLFLDLDVIIVSNIDCFFKIPGNFLIAHDKKRPKKIEGNSSVFRFNIGEHSDVLDFFIKNFDKVKKQVRHEQAYLSREIYKKGILSYWPDIWVPSFKYHCLPSWNKRFYQTSSIPMQAKIIIFHGSPNPPEAILGKSGKWYRYIKPSPWIEKYWRE